MSWYGQGKDLLQDLIEKAGDAVGSLLGNLKDGVLGLATAAGNVVDMVRGGDNASVSVSSEAVISNTPANTMHQAVAAPSQSITEIVASLPAHVSQAVQQIRDNSVQLASLDLSPAGQAPENYPPMPQADLAYGVTAARQASVGRG